MLTEIRDANQEAGQSRRWFEGDGLELIVWCDEAGGVEAFQLCYADEKEERALTWRGSAGGARARVSVGDTTPVQNQASIRVAATESATGIGDPLARFFWERAAGLDAGIRDLVTAKLAESR